jgi:hypothetical protein
MGVGGWGARTVHTGGFTRTCMWVSRERLGVALSAPGTLVGHLAAPCQVVPKISGKPCIPGSKSLRHNA